jgi:hypothetical protein
LDHGNSATLKILSRTDNRSDQCGDLIRSGVQYEMTCIQDVDFGVRYVLAVAFRLAEIERKIVLAPDHQ